MNHLDMFAGFVLTVLIQTVYITYRFSKLEFKVDLVWDWFRKEKHLNGNGAAKSLGD